MLNTGPSSNPGWIRCRSQGTLYSDSASYQDYEYMSKEMSTCRTNEIHESSRMIQKKK